MPFRVKICGVTSATDVRAASAAGANALGLNFYSASKRYLSPERARDLIQNWPDGVLKVGLFVNESSATMQQAAAVLGLDVIQLHGEEPPALVQQLRGLPVVKAFRLLAGELNSTLDFVHACAALGAPLAGVLVDAHQPDARGGTGCVADWNLARNLSHRIPQTPVILAGGLTPANVAEAIAAVRPFGVDTASGVESAPGVKDASLMTAFVAAAKSAQNRSAHV